MKQFNINHCIYIQITEKGWRHLRNTVGEDYINHCIKSPHYEKTINGEVWYKLQAHHVFSLLPIGRSFGDTYYKTTILFDEDDLIEL